MAKIFIPNPNYANEIREQKQYKSWRAGVAEEAVAVARSIAPVRTGHYRDSIYADKETGMLCSSDAAAEIIEFGWRLGPGYAVMRRAVRMMSLELSERPKP